MKTGSNKDRPVQVNIEMVLVGILFFKEKQSM